MFAIANILSGMSRELSARLAGMDRQTLRDWVHRFNAGGVEGLRDLPHTSRPAELDADARQKLCARVEQGPDPGKDGFAACRMPPAACPRGGGRRHGVMSGMSK